MSSKMNENDIIISGFSIDDISSGYNITNISSTNKNSGSSGKKDTCGCCIVYFIYTNNLVVTRILLVQI